MAAASAKDDQVVKKRVALLQKREQKKVATMRHGYSLSHVTKVVYSKLSPRGTKMKVGLHLGQMYLTKRPVGYHECGAYSLSTKLDIIKPS